MSRRKENRSRHSRPAVRQAAGRISKHEILGLTAILLTTFVVYFPTLNGAQLWDDDANITRPELQSVGGLYRIWFEPGATQQYYPLLHTAFWIEHKLWGNSLRGYHAVNILWHMVSIVLLYAVLRRLGIPGALLAAAIFALHPVMVESVAWVTEQKNTLSTMFYLASALVYIQFDTSRKRSQYLAALALFFLALCSKTAIVTLPAALLVILWWQRGTLLWRRDFLPTVPFFIVAALAGLMTCFVEWNHVGAVGAPFEFNFFERLLLAGRAVWFYLFKLLWPANLIFIYPRWQPDVTQWWQWLFPIAALAMTAALWAIRKRARAPLAAWLFFCGTLLPMLPFLNQYLFMYTFVSDHFQYVAGMGIIALVSSGITLGLKRLPQSARWFRLALPLSLLTMLAVLSYRHTKLYAHNVALYTDTLNRNPACWMAHNNLGSELQAKGNQQAGMDHFRAALRINPRSATAHNNLGNLLKDTGKLPEAIESFRVALELEPDNAVILNNLAAALIHANNLDEARSHLERALELKPDYAEAHLNMGLALALSGNLAEAALEFRRASDLNPTDATAESNWGFFLASGGKFAEAADHYEVALKRQPGRVDVRSNLADALRQTGKPSEAIEHYRAALRANPNYLQAHVGLAQAFALVGQPSQAIRAAKHAIERARSANQTPVAEYVENWLKNYESELSRANPAPPPPPSSK